MAKAAVALAVVSLVLGAAHAMDCSFGQSSNFVDKLINSCPTIVEPSKTKCCYNLEKSYCCDDEEFAIRTGLTIIIPAIIAVVVVISLIVCCISCLCCACCPWYRRRHRGTVYGNLQPQPVVHVIQPATVYNGYVPQQSQTQQAPRPMVYPTEMAQPPQYTHEAYTKQAPYNPNYNL